MDRGRPLSALAFFFGGGGEHDAINPGGLGGYKTPFCIGRTLRVAGVFRTSGGYLVLDMSTMCVCLSILYIQEALHANSYITWQQAFKSESSIINVARA